MSSIVTLTVNPAVDKSTSVAALIPEKKLKCKSPVYEPGGGGINVARAVKKLGGDAFAIYLGGGSNGVLMEELLTQERVKSKRIHIQNSTRENLTVLDDSTHQQYRFGMPGPNIAEEEWLQCLDVLEQISDLEFVVAGGSLSPGMPDDFFGRVSAVAKKKNAKLVLDTSGEPLKLAVNEGAYLLKPNLAELASLAGKSELSPHEIVDCAKSVILKGNCKIIIVSLGAAGGLLVTEKVELQVTAPSVKRESTVGAGDSMVAGIVLSLSKGRDLLESLQYGVACGTAATMNPGTELCRLKDAQVLYDIIKVSSQK